MILEVSAFRVLSPRDASDSSASDGFAKTSPALESDASQSEGTRRAESSRIIVFVFAGWCSGRAQPNAMILEVSALRMLSLWDASDSSAGDVFAKTLPALESDAPSV